MTIVAIAEKVAREAHSGQYRRDGITPYITHPERIVSRLPGDFEAQAVAWLHDVLEDTDVSDEALREAGLPKNIVAAVQALTKTSGIDYYDYLGNVRRNDLARKVKIQDMLDNLSESPTEKQIVKYAKGFLVLFNVDFEP